MDLSELGLGNRQKARNLGFLLPFKGAQSPNSGQANLMHVCRDEVTHKAILTPLHESTLSATDTSQISRR
jgi:hypothetical protein